VILLDTDIISEALKPQGDPAVVAWLDAQALETLFLSTITLAELRFGIAAMPVPRRKGAADF
jgi:toxin FitB